MISSDLKWPPLYGLIFMDDFNMTLKWLQMIVMASYEFKMTSYGSQMTACDFKMTLNDSRMTFYFSNSWQEKTTGRFGKQTDTQENKNFAIRAPCQKNCI